MITDSKDSKNCKNCIFLCVFQDVQDAFTLLESLFIFGNLTSSTDIVIYTTPLIKERLTQSHLVHGIVFVLKEEPTGKERFELSVVSTYETVLYLDTKCVVKEDLSPLFESVQPDKAMVYVVEEDRIYSFTPETGESIHFLCPMLLFQPSAIESLFLDRTDSPDSRYTKCSADVYTQLDHSLNRFASSGPSLYSDKLIHYVPSTNRTFLNELKEVKIHIHLQEAKLFVLKHLLPIIHRSGESLEGNIFMTHHTTQFTDLFLDKQRNISNLVLNRQVVHGMEIGFNAGFSSLLMLLSNPGLHLTCFDLGEHRYTRPCYEMLRQHFGSRIELILGNSMETLKTATGTFDLIHIDGGHEIQVATSDIVHSYRLSKPGTLLILDDYDFPNLCELWNGFVQAYSLKPLDIPVYPSPHHDIKQV